MVEDAARILVVDDNEMNRDMLSRRLMRLGHDTVIAEDGYKALEAIQNQPFDLVLLDIMMPNLNGYETLERIKSDNTTRDIPVIMISAVDDLDSVVKCIELGAEDYLFKPFNPVLLKARVGACLEKRHMRKSISTDSNSLAGNSQAHQIILNIQQGLESLAQVDSGLNQAQQSTIGALLEQISSLLKMIT